MAFISKLLIYGIVIHVDCRGSVKSFFINYTALCLEFIPTFLGLAIGGTCLHALHTSYAKIISQEYYLFVHLDGVSF